MWRYYLAATLIVIVLGSALVAHRLAANSGNRDARAHAPPPPHAGPNAGFVTTPAPSFVGQGGWVLSALPDCFEQLSAIEGPVRALTFHVPPARERIAPGATLRSGRCTVTVGAHEVTVVRGRDRLRVPPEARLYAAKAGLTLVFDHGDAAEVRVYRRRAPR